MLRYFRLVHTGAFSGPPTLEICDPSQVTREWGCSRQFLNFIIRRNSISYLNTCLRRHSFTPPDQHHYAFVVQYCYILLVKISPLTSSEEFYRKCTPFCLAHTLQHLPSSAFVINKDRCYFGHRQVLGFCYEYGLQIVLRGERTVRRE